MAVIVRAKPTKIILFSAKKKKSHFFSLRKKLYDFCKLL